MSEANLKYIAGRLCQIFTGEANYAGWLNPGIRSIILDGSSEETAFEHAHYIIGTEPDEWKKDIATIYRGLTHRHQAFFCTGLAKCIDGVGAEIGMNDPGRNNGMNLERLALTFMSIARDIRATQCLDCLPNLIRSKFPRSQAVYDAALLTWRVMAEGDSFGNWHEIFCPDANKGQNELRYRASYSPLIAFGMCVARPREQAYFLHKWSPLWKYLDNLTQELEELGNLKKLQKVMAAIKKIDAEHPASKPCWNPIMATFDMLTEPTQEYKQTQMLKDAEAAAATRRWALPAANDDSMDTKTPFEDLELLEGQPLWNH